MDTVLNCIKTTLSNKFKGQILRFILIGSKLYNDQRDNSDYDIVVITDDSTDSYELIKDMTPLISNICVRFKTIISIYPIKEAVLTNKTSQFIKNVITKGIEF